MQAPEYPSSHPLLWGFDALDGISPYPHHVLEGSILELAAKDDGASLVYGVIDLDHLVLSSSGTVACLTICGPPLRSAERTERLTVILEERLRPVGQSLTDRGIIVS